MNSSGQTAYSECGSPASGLPRDGEERCRECWFPLRAREGAFASAAYTEGSDIAVFAGDRKGIIYVQGQRVANIPEEEILDRLLAECRKFQDRVRSGEAKLGEKTVEIVPPEVSGEAGTEHVTIGKS